MDKVHVTLDKFMSECDARRKAGKSAPTWANMDTATHVAYLFPNGQGYTEFCWLVHKAELRAYFDKLASS